MKDDVIYRRDAIDALFELYEYQASIDPTEAADLMRQGVYLAEKKIEQLPSAPPSLQGWVCPVCGRGLSPFTTVCPCKNGKGWGITCQTITDNSLKR